MSATSVARLALAATIAALAACSIEPRSAGFACEGPADCPADRVCESGWCVLPGGGGGDGGGSSDGGGGSDAGPTGDAAPVVCSEAICDACDDDGTCVLLCTQGEACPETVVCPVGIPCRVVCSGLDACAGGVDCTAASRCEVVCAKNRACAGPVECGSGRCDVECSGRDSCLAGVDCSDSCGCDTRCYGSGACPGGPVCPFDECVEDDLDCTVDDNGCDTCGG